MKKHARLNMMSHLLSTTNHGDAGVSVWMNMSSLARE